MDIMCDVLVGTAQISSLSDDEWTAPVLPEREPRAPHPSQYPSTRVPSEIGRATTSFNTPKLEFATAAAMTNASERGNHDMTS